MLNINTQKQKQNKKKKKKNNNNTVQIQHYCNNYMLYKLYCCFFLAQITVMDVKKSTHTQSKERRSKNKILKQ